VLDAVAAADDLATVAPVGGQEPVELHGSPFLPLVEQRASAARECVQFV
jgi:hypothetical protein